MALDGGTRVEDSSTVDARSGAGPIARRLGRVERELWALAALALLGDLVLTYHGLERGLREANPLARLAVERHGYAALGALKLLALGVAAAGRLVVPGRYGAVVPLALAAPWTVAVVLNAVTILAVA